MISCMQVDPLCVATAKNFDYYLKICPQHILPFYLCQVLSRSVSPALRRATRTCTSVSLRFASKTLLVDVGKVEETCGASLCTPCLQNLFHDVAWTLRRLGLPRGGINRRPRPRNLQKRHTSGKCFYSTQTSFQPIESTSGYRPIGSLTNYARFV